MSNGTLVQRRESSEMAAGGFMEQAASSGDLVQRVQGTYATAMSVRRPRELGKVRQALTVEADFAGESFFYGWGAGKDRIEGPSVDCAMAALRAWGNCALEMQPVQETHDAWIFTVAFVDLESGVTVPRQFRQSKKWQVFGKLDGERKDDIRFQIGQSKAIRNVVLNAVPKWLITQAIEQAKAGAKAKLEAYITANGIAKAAELVLKGLQKHGVTDERVLAKAGVAKREGLDIDCLLMLRADLNALNEGREFASELFPSPDADKVGTSEKAKEINERLSQGRQATAPAAVFPAPAPDDHPEPPIDEPPAGNSPQQDDAEMAFGVWLEELKGVALEKGVKPEKWKKSVDAWLKTASKGEHGVPTKKACDELQAAVAEGRGHFAVAS